MISIEEAQELMEKFISLRSSNDKITFAAHERICIEKFKYLITMRTDRYKNFFNYDDLVQEGMYALVAAMKNYNPTKGSWFWWAHKYIDTRIARTANLHTAIRFPLKYAKANPPHRENNLPIMLDFICPETTLDKKQILSAIKTAMKKLKSKHKKIMYLYFGLYGDKPMSVNKICKELKMSRVKCSEYMNTAFEILKKHIVL